MEVEPQHICCFKSARTLPQGDFFAKIFCNKSSSLLLQKYLARRKHDQFLVTLISRVKLFNPLLHVVKWPNIL